MERVFQRGCAAAEIIAAKSGTGAYGMKRHHHDGGRITAALFVEIAQRLGLKSEVLGDIERQATHGMIPEILRGFFLA